MWQIYIAPGASANSQKVWAICEENPRLTAFGPAGGTLQFRESTSNKVLNAVIKGKMAKGYDYHQSSHNPFVYLNASVPNGFPRQWLGVIGAEEEVSVTSNKSQRPNLVVKLVIPDGDKQSKWNSVLATITQHLSEFVEENDTLICGDLKLPKNIVEPKWKGLFAFDFGSFKEERREQLFACCLLLKEFSGSKIHDNQNRSWEANDWRQLLSEYQIDPDARLHSELAMDLGIKLNLNFTVDAKTNYYF
jgi:hypothetical protein